MVTEDEHRAAILKLERYFQWVRWMKKVFIDLLNEKGLSPRVEAARPESETQKRPRMGKLPVTYRLDFVVA